MKTYTPSAKGYQRKWFVIDAADQTLGKISTKVADILRGKYKPDFTPHLDLGDFVIITNCDKFKLSGTKSESIKYYRHSGYAKDGLKEVTLTRKMESDPTYAMSHAISGMIPRNKNKKDVLKRLKLFTGEDHGHEAQKPEAITL